MSIYVSPTGSDANPGTEALPKLTFAAGLAAWKTDIASALVNTGLYLERGSTYNITATQFLSSANNHPVSGKRLKIGAYGTGEIPWITARNAVTGWSLDSGSVVSAPLAALASPAVLQDVWCDDRTELRMCTFGATDDLSRVYQWGTVATTKHARVPKTALPTVASWSGVYFVVQQGWSLSRIRIDTVTSVDATYSDITFLADDGDIFFAKGDLSQPGPSYSLGMGFPTGPYNNNSGQRFWFENAPEFLTEAGEFYHDTANGRLRVWLPSGVANAAAFEAKGIYVSNGCEIPLQINGAAVGTKIKNLDIENVGFEHIGSNMKDDGYFVGYVSGAGIIKSGASSFSFRAMGSALYLYYSESVSVRGCRFRDIGSIGIKSLWAMHGLDMRQNAFERMGSSAFVVGSAPFPEFSDAATNAQNLGLHAKNNVTYDTGRRWMGSAMWCGIWLTGEVSQNTIRKSTDDGISYSTGARCYGIWAGDFRVHHNDIEEVMTLTVDGGAVYSSGNMSQNNLRTSPTTLAVPRRPAKIYLNRIRNVRASGFDPSGGHTAMIYWDLGSEGNMAWRNDCDDGDVFWLENCGKFNFVEDNKVGDDVDELEEIGYAGFNVVVDSGGVTISTTAYYPPLAATGATNIAKFDGTGGYNAFKTVVPFATIADCFKVDGSYESLSLRANNNSSVVLGTTRYGVDEETAELYADILEAA